MFPTLAPSLSAGHRSAAMCRLNGGKRASLGKRGKRASLNCAVIGQHGLRSSRGTDGPVRQPVLTNSLQINYNDNRAIQLDIDPFNSSFMSFRVPPPVGLLEHGLFQVLPNAVRGRDSDYHKIAQELGLNVYNCPQ